MTTVKERRQAKAIKRSQAATKVKKVHRSEADLVRLERFKRSQLLFKKFKL